MGSEGAKTEKCVGISQKRYSDSSSGSDFSSVASRRRRSSRYQLLIGRISSWIGSGKYASVDESDLRKEMLISDGSLSREESMSGQTLLETVTSIIVARSMHEPDVGCTFPGCSCKGFQFLEFDPKKLSTLSKKIGFQEMVSYASKLAMGCKECAHGDIWHRRSKIKRCPLYSEIEKERSSTPSSAKPITDLPKEENHNRVRPDLTKEASKSSVETESSTVTTDFNLAFSPRQKSQNRHAPVRSLTRASSVPTLESFGGFSSTRQQQDL